MINFLFSHHEFFGHFSFFFIIKISFPIAHVYIFTGSFTVYAGYVYITDILSIPTITEVPSVECKDLWILC